MATKMFSETKAYSKQIESPKFLEALRASSVSDIDAKNRLKVYSKVFANNEQVRESMRAFSGYSEMPILTNTYFNCSISALIRSFAGYLSIERDMAQPNAVLGYYDLLGINDNRVVMPNVGYGDVNGLQAPMVFEGKAATKQFSHTFSERLIPGSVEAIATYGEKSYTLRDDANGSLMAAPGVLSAATINYTTGAVSLTFANEAAATADVKVKAAKDCAADPEVGKSITSTVNRFKLQKKYYHANAVPTLLISEYDLMTMAAADKAMSDDVVAILGTKLTNLYQRIINKSLVDAIVRADISTPYVIDMAAAANKFLDFGSRIEFFEAELVNVDTELAHQSGVAIAATAYVVGQEVGNWFMKSKQFVKNTDATFVDDLLGTYNGIPVLRQITLDPMTGYAVHKTADGTIAPTIFGQFLPLTSVPVTGNYQNPTQQAAGVYFQAATDSIEPLLAQKFTVTKVSELGRFRVDEVTGE